MTKKNVAVILTALEVEFLAVRAHLCDTLPERHPQGTLYDVGRFPSAGGDWKVAIVQTGAGNVRAALEAERAIAHFAPSHVLFVGIAGGLKDVRLGDVVAATKVYGYEAGKAEKEFLTRTDLGESAYELVQQAMAVARDCLWHPRLAALPGTAPHAFVAPVAAGEKVVASTVSEAYQLLRHSFSDALAVEMEGLGMLRAVYASPGVRALVVRGISDLIDKKAEADAGGSHPVAAAHAAGFAFEVLARVDSQPEPPRLATSDSRRGLAERGKLAWREQLS